MEILSLRILHILYPWVMHPATTRFPSNSALVPNPVLNALIPWFVFKLSPNPYSVVPRSSSLLALGLTLLVSFGHLRYRPGFGHLYCCLNYFDILCCSPLSQIHISLLNVVVFLVPQLLTHLNKWVGWTGRIADHKLDWRCYLWSGWDDIQGRGLTCCICDCKGCELSGAPMVSVARVFVVVGKGLLA